MTLDQEIEKRQEDTLAQARESRRDRILAGKTDAFDCFSESEVVCPHCGQWFDGALFAIPHPRKGYTSNVCGSCDEIFYLNIQVRHQYSTVKPD